MRSPPVRADPVRTCPSQSPYGIVQKFATLMINLATAPTEATQDRRLPMPARFVAVHDDHEFTSVLMRRLGSDLAWFDDPIKALNALESARSIEFLITRLQFADRQPLGLSLARVARASRPDVRVIFTGLPRHRDYARGLGEFIPEPVDAVHIGMLIGWLTASDQEEIRSTNQTDPLPGPGMNSPCDVR